MGKDNLAKNAEVLNTVVNALSQVDQESRESILVAVSSFFRMNPQQSTLEVPVPVHLPSSSAPRFSEDRALSPKAFLLEKRPHTDIERVACLAYYLSHYRDTPHFKTLDISKLNTEAAQAKFSNAAWAVENALKRGFLAPAAKGLKQLSAMGEEFVLVLPDRDEAKKLVLRMRPRKRARKIIRG